MAVITGTVKGVMSLKDDPSSGDSKLAYVTFTMPLFASTDTGTLAVATALQNSRRNGKTVTLRSACRGEAGLGVTTKYYTSTEAVSSGNITFQMCNQTGTQIASPSAGTLTVGSANGDRPMSMVVSFDEA